MTSTNNSHKIPSALWALCHFTSFAAFNLSLSIMPATNNAKTHGQATLPLTGHFPLVSHWFSLKTGPFTFLFLRNLKSEETSLGSHSSMWSREHRRHLQPGLVGLGPRPSWARQLSHFSLSTLAPPIINWELNVARWVVPGRGSRTVAASPGERWAHTRGPTRRSRRQRRRSPGTCYARISMRTQTLVTKHVYPFMFKRISGNNEFEEFFPFKTRISRFYLLFVSDVNLNMFSFKWWGRNLALSSEIDIKPSWLLAFRFILLQTGEELIDFFPP